MWGRATKGVRDMGQGRATMGGTCDQGGDVGQERATKGGGGGVCNQGGQGRGSGTCNQGGHARTAGLPQAGSKETWLCSKSHSLWYYPHSQVASTFMA